MSNINTFSVFEFLFDFVLLCVMDFSYSDWILSRFLRLYNTVLEQSELLLLVSYVL